MYGIGISIVCEEWTCHVNTPGGFILLSRRLKRMGFLEWCCEGVSFHDFPFQRQKLPSF